MPSQDTRHATHENVLFRERAHQPVQNAYMGLAGVSPASDLPYSGFTFTPYRFFAKPFPPCTWDFRRRRFSQYKFCSTEHAAGYWLVGFSAQACTWNWPSLLCRIVPVQRLSSASWISQQTTRRRSFRRAFPTVVVEEVPLWINRSLQFVTAASCGYR